MQDDNKHSMFVVALIELSIVLTILLWILFIAGIFNKKPAKQHWPAIVAESTTNCIGCKPNGLYTWNGIDGYTNVNGVKIIW